jgi:translation initiation factor 4G
MNGYFSQLDGIVRQRKTSNRIRFMIQDVMDLRRNQWKPRREDNNPKTIEQIHKDAERERTEQEQELMNAPNFPGSMGQSSRDRPGDRRDRDDRNRKASRKCCLCYLKCRFQLVAGV